MPGFLPGLFLFWVTAMFELSVHADVRALKRSMSDFTNKQLPFAISQGINRTAARVAEAESANIRQTFKHPTPFTQKSVGIVKARKSNPVAIVYMKDITASYLKPYETGGSHKLNSQALLNPKDIKLNQFGQLSRGTLARLKARSDIFIGPVKTKDGQMVNGVWQRPFLRGRDANLGAGMSVRKRNKLLRGMHPNMPKGANTTGKLVLLLRFGDALPVNKRLNWGARANQTVNRSIAADLAAALAAALTTAR